MIKVELFYKVSMYDSDWMMTEAEYDEFRKSANNLPVFFTGPKIKDREERMKQEKEADQLIREISHKPINPLIASLVGWPVEDEAKECPDYIEPPVEEPVVSKTIGTGFLINAPEVVCENGACRLVLEDEEPEVESYENLTESEDKSKDKKKPGRKTKMDFSKYIQLYEDGVGPKEIKAHMQDEMQISNLTAEQYYYTRVKKEVIRKQAEAKDRANEKEKKRFAEHLEKKIQVIPPTVYNKPDNGKCFSDEDREKLQKKLGLK